MTSNKEDKTTSSSQAGPSSPSPSPSAGGVDVVQSGNDQKAADTKAANSATASAATAASPAPTPTPGADTKSTGKKDEKKDNAPEPPKGEEKKANEAKSGMPSWQESMMALVDKVKDDAKIAKDLKDNVKNAVGDFAKDMFKNEGKETKGSLDKIGDKAAEVLNKLFGDKKDKPGSDAKSGAEMGKGADTATAASAMGDAKEAANSDVSIAQGSKGPTPTSTSTSTPANDEENAPSFKK